MLELDRANAWQVGDHVAELRPTPGHGICVATTAGPLHWSVWGRREILHDAVALLIPK